MRLHILSQLIFLKGFGIYDSRLSNAGITCRSTSRLATSLFLLGFSAFLFAGCSVKQTAVNLLGDALAVNGPLHSLLSEFRALIL